MASQFFPVPRMWTTLIALLLVAASLALLLYLGNLLWGAARLPLGSFIERRRFESYVARATRGDRFLRDGKVAMALAEFSGSFYPYPATNLTMADAVIRHHTALLSRLFAAADQVQDERLRLISLAKVDRLLHERRSLQRRFVTLQQSGSRRRLHRLDHEFRENTEELRLGLKTLAREIAATPGNSPLH